MNYADVSLRISKLPSTFQRPGDTYGWWLQSFLASLTRASSSVDATLAQATLNNASGPWLDVWGRTFGVIRFDGEADAVYFARIVGTLTAWRGTVPAIIAYINLVMGINAKVTESTDGVAGWTMTLPVALAPAGIAKLCEALNFVRPAGVPFQLIVVHGGLVLSSLNFFGAGSVTGAYLGYPDDAVTLPIGASTNNATPTLPTLFLTDPTINPSLRQ